MCLKRSNKVSEQICPTVLGQLEQDHSFSLHICRPASNKINTVTYLPDDAVFNRHKVPVNKFPLHSFHLNTRKFSRFSLDSTELKS